MPNGHETCLLLVSGANRIAYESPQYPAHQYHPGRAHPQVCIGRCCQNVRADMPEKRTIRHFDDHPTGSGRNKAQSKLRELFRHCQVVRRFRSARLLRGRRLLLGRCYQLIIDQKACHAALLRILSSAAIALNQLYTLYALGNEAHRRFARYMKNTSTAGNRTIAGALSR